MNWHEISVTIPLSLLEPAYNFMWPYVHGLFVESTDNIFTIRAFIFCACPDQILKKLKNFLRIQARTLEGVHPTPAAGPVVSAYTDRFIIVPAPTSYTPPFGMPIFIQRGKAFGLGCHPCTFYCVQALQNIYTKDPDLIRSGKILDAGIGTGILSIATAKLGAEYILGVDINNESIKEAEENLSLNNVKNKIKLLLCSVTVIAQNASHLEQLLSPKGWLIIGGMSVPQDDIVISNFTKLGLTESSRLRNEEWSVAILHMD